MTRLRGGLGKLWRRLRPILILALFLAGAGAGMLIFRMVSPDQATGPYPTLPAGQEPVAAAVVARALASDDEATLAVLLDGDTLQVLGDTITPVIDVRSVAFVGAVSAGQDTLAGYIVRGRDNQAQGAMVALVLRVRNGSVVSIN